MEVVNCQSWTSLRSYPNTQAPRLMKVPLGAWVTNCHCQDEKYTYCEYNGVGGYILNSNLSFIYAPYSAYGYAYSADDYLGTARASP